jgi:hypothetical protein
MSTQARTDTHETRTNSPSASISISGERLVPLVIVLALLSGIGIGMAMLSMRESSKAEREARVMQERWNDLKVELVRRGIPVSDH